MANSKTIVFIHGLFQNPKGWVEWKTYFEANGYNCYSPAYPFHEGEPAELRKNINPKLGKLTLGQVTDSVFTPNAEWFQQTFCNTMTLKEAEIEFDKSVVPESRNIARTSIKDDGYVDFKKPHQPILFISGSEDHLIPTSLNKKNFEAYKDKNSQKDFKIFAGRTHYICNQKNWEEVASYVKEWITNLK